MDYLNSLQCKTEPFSSRSGTDIYLCQGVRNSIAELSRYIHIGAGLQLVIGADGTGKTTLLHQLAQKFSADNKISVLLLNNPQFSDLQQFLITVAGIFKTIKAPFGFDDNTFQQAFNSFFYKVCKEEKKIVLLLIDNGQDLPDFCLHALNSFYDHHPDCQRFLQTVICAEPSFQRKINANKALKNRVVYTTAPKPFNFKDIRRLIRFHLERAAVDPISPPALFSIAAQWVIYRMTQGHPKLTIDLCHFIVLTLVIENRKKADWFMTLRVAKSLIPKRAIKLQIIRTSFLSGLIVLMLVLGLWSQQVLTLNVSKLGQLFQVTISQKVQQPEVQALKPLNVLQETGPPKQTREALQTESAAIEKTLPPVMPAEEQAAGMEPSEKSAAVPHRSEDSASTKEVPVPESAGVMDEEAVSRVTPVSKPETIDTPTIREIQEEEKPSAAAAVLETQPGKESVPERQPVDALERLNKPVEPPEYLGDIITAPGENFGDMVRRIYGPWSFNPENVKTVLAVNPDLKSPELLNVGDKIHFPTIPVTLTPGAEEVWWVRITAFDNIQSAYRFLRKYRKSSPSLVIIPSRDDSGMVLMNILLEEHFMDKESAQKAIKALPALTTPQTEALYGLSPATFYYRLQQND